MHFVWVEEKIDGDFSIIRESADFKQHESKVNDGSINAFIKTLLRVTVTALEQVDQSKLKCQIRDKTSSKCLLFPIERGSKLALFNVALIYLRYLFF